MQRATTNIPSLCADSIAPDTPPIVCPSSRHPAAGSSGKKVRRAGICLMVHDLRMCMQGMTWSGA